MPKLPDYLQWLAQLFDEQRQRLHEPNSLEERTQLLRRVKILIDKIDDAILSALQDKPATKSSSPPDQPTAESAFSVCWLRSVADNVDGGENRIAIKSAYPGLM